MQNCHGLVGLAMARRLGSPHVARQPLPWAIILKYRSITLAGGGGRVGLFYILNDT